jgi:hypothetical protein
LQGIAYFSRSLDTAWMKPKDESPEAAEGLRLVRAFLLLPPDRRRLVLKFVEELSRAQDRREEGAETSPTTLA